MNAKVGCYVALVFAGCVGVGFSYDDGRLHAFVSGRTGVRAVRYQTCLSMDEVRWGNVQNALGCPEDNGRINFEKTLSYAPPLRPATISYSKNAGGENVKLNVAGNIPLDDDLAVQVGVNYELYSSHPEKGAPTGRLNELRCGKVSPLESGVGTFKVSKEFLEAISKSRMYGMCGRSIVGGVQTSVTQGNAQASPILGGLNGRSSPSVTGTSLNNAPCSLH